MQQGETAGGVLVQQRLPAQPVEQLVAVPGLEDVVEGVAASLAAAVGQRQQVQVVVAQDAQGRRSEAAHEAQGLQGLRAAVDQVPGEPQPVPGRIEAQLVEEPAQRVVATLEIANGVSGHGIFGNGDSGPTKPMSGRKPAGEAL